MLRRLRILPDAEKKSKLNKSGRTGRKESVKPLSGPVRRRGAEIRCTCEKFLNPLFSKQIMNSTNQGIKMVTDTQKLQVATDALKQITYDGPASAAKTATAALAILAAPSTEQPASCICGEPATAGIEHRTDGPCHVTEQPAAASVDGPEFQALLPDDLARFRRDEIVSFVNAWGAQQREAGRESGYRAGKNTWKDYGDEQFKRAEAAEKERDDLREEFDKQNMAFFATSTKLAYVEAQLELLTWIGGVAIVMVLIAIAFPNPVSKKDMEGD